MQGSKKSSQVDDPVTNLRAVVDEAISSATALGTTVTKLERSTRGPEALAVLARLSVAAGEFIDRLHSTRIGALGTT